MRHMAKITHIHQSKQPVRRHFLNEWMESREWSVQDLLDLLNDPERSMDLKEVSKSQVYRWLDGQMPQGPQQKRIAGAFEIEPEALLRHPDDDWLARFMRGRTPEEIRRIKEMLELAFPKKAG